MTSPYIAWLHHYVKDEYHMGWLFNLEDAHRHALMAENCGHMVWGLYLEESMLHKGGLELFGILNMMKLTLVGRPLYSTKLVEET